MWNTIELSYILPVFFNQRDTKTLDNLLSVYASYDPEIMAKIQFIIVDDGSPVAVTISPEIKLNYRLFRVKDNILWNQAGARNLGVVCAAAPKIILTDCDHIFPESLFQKILESKTPRKTIFKFRRIDHHGQPIPSAYNIFYTSKAVFFAGLGYDEEFCGYYGYEDVMFRELQHQIGHRTKCFSLRKKICFPSVDHEFSYHNLDRDFVHNKSLYEHKKTFLTGKNPFLSHSRLFLNFDYDLMSENHI